MTTRLSKIARLPATIREQLNLRLHNGQFGRKILPWVNNLPETKEVLAENFDAKPITHQNLSEWRYTGYQDWLQQQERKAWFNTLTEQDNELDDHDKCGDPYEAMSRFFLVEIGQAFAALKNIKNSDARFTRLQNLTREFARLQNAYNWSRRVGIDWEKYNDQSPPEPEEPNEHEIQSPEPSDNRDHALENGDRARSCPSEPWRSGTGHSEPRPRGSHLGVETPDTVEPPLNADVRGEKSPKPIAPLEPRTSAPPVAEASRLQDIVARASCPCESHGRDARATTEERQNPSTDSPTPTPDLRTPNCDLPSSNPAFDPIPPLAPTTPTTPSNPAINPRIVEQLNALRKSRASLPTKRNRRFICIEG